MYLPHTVAPNLRPRICNVSESGRQRARVGTFQMAGLRRWNRSPGSWNVPHAQEPRDPSLRWLGSACLSLSSSLFKCLPGSPAKAGTGPGLPRISVPSWEGGALPTGQVRLAVGRPQGSWLDSHQGRLTCGQRKTKSPKLRHPWTHQLLPAPEDATGRAGRGENRGRCSHLELHIGDRWSEKTHVKMSLSTSRVITDAKARAWRPQADRGRSQSHGGHIADRSDIS